MQGVGCAWLWVSGLRNLSAVPAVPGTCSGIHFHILLQMNNGSDDRFADIVIGVSYIQMCMGAV